MKKTDIVEYKGRDTVAQDVAEVVARELHGMTDWRGVQDGIWAPSGLKTMMNRYLRKLFINAIVTEDTFGVDDGESLYSPAWK